MGSVTGFKCTRMSPVDTFNGLLASKVLTKEFGTKEKAEKHQNMLMLLGNGIRK